MNPWNDESISEQMKERQSDPGFEARKPEQEQTDTGYLHCLFTDSGLAGEYYTLVKTNIIIGRNIRTY